MPARPKAKPLHVTVVCKTKDTIEDLRAYFDRSGVPTHGTRILGEASTIPPATSAVVLFPDDYDGADVIALVLELRRARPRVLLLLVTREARRFELALAPDGRSIPPIVLPRPSFGWSILDTIRAHGQVGS